MGEQSRYRWLAGEVILLTKKDKGDKLKVRTDTVCPQFYHFQSKQFTDVSVEFAGASKKGQRQLWASESFTTHLINGKDQAHKTIPDPMVWLEAVHRSFFACL